MTPKNDKKSEYLSSLKSIETENLIDRSFYRPIGFKIAKALKNTGITPNMVTILSVFVGMCAGIAWWFPYNVSCAVIGILALVFANILDCVDGQLARMTGIKSEVGRILDGLAGDLWFASIYIAFAHRLNLQFSTPFDPWIYFIIILLSAISHWNQASLTDYYKTLHLLFISREKGKEFEHSDKIIARYRQMPKGINKVITWGYIGYTKNQERQTPQLQKMLARIEAKYGKDFPDEKRDEFRKKSADIMPLLNINTFNGRSIILFISVLFNIIWFYFLWEIIVLNITKEIIRYRHEKACKNFENEA